MLRLHYLHRFTRNHPRVVIALAFGLLVGIAMPSAWTPVTRALTGWNVAVWSYLVMMGWLMTRADHERVRTLAEQEDESAVALLCIMSIAATISLAAIILELATTRDVPAAERAGHYLFTILTVLGSWCLVAVNFTHHYARSFYRSPRERRSLRFPDDEQSPNYWDFLYLSFTIAVAAQTSDIAITSCEMRKTVLAQSILSFIFNAAILGLSINIAAGAVGT
jgi:uncharacterized membrane protein